MLSAKPLLQRACRLAARDSNQRPWNKNEKHFKIRICLIQVFGVFYFLPMLTGLVTSDVVAVDRIQNGETHLLNVKEWQSEEFLVSGGFGIDLDTSNHLIYRGEESDRVGEINVVATVCRLTKADLVIPRRWVYSGMPQCKCNVIDVDVANGWKAVKHQHICSGESARCGSKYISTCVSEINSLERRIEDGDEEENRFGKNRETVVVNEWRQTKTWIQIRSTRWCGTGASISLSNSDSVVCDARQTLIREAFHSASCLIRELDYRFLF
ncbi:hypothetical protein CBL_03172 [Carabus blaptoides fortunei]